MQYIIIWGCIVDGFDFIGPFNCFDGAIEYAQSDRDIRNSDYKIQLLQTPAKD